MRSEIPDHASGALTIRFFLPEPGDAGLALFDERGAIAAMLHDGHLPAGEHAIPLEARVLPAGRYFCRLLAGTGMAVGKIIVEPR